MCMEGGGGKGVCVCVMFIVATSIDYMVRK